MEKLVKLAKTQNVNPYYLAYAIDTGAESCEAAFKRDGGNYLYFVWNEQRWFETCQRIGISKEFRSSFVEEHIKTLSSHLGNKLEEYQIKKVKNMKINFNKQLKEYQLAYAIDGNNKYCVSIDNWNHSYEVVNIATGLVIGYFCNKTKKFKRSWGFRKDLGKNGKVLKSAIK